MNGHLSKNTSAADTFTYTYIHVCIHCLQVAIRAAEGLCRELGGFWLKLSWDRYSFISIFHRLHFLESVLPPLDSDDKTSATMELLNRSKEHHIEMPHGPIASRSIICVKLV